MSRLLYLEPFAMLSVYFCWHFLLSSRELFTTDGQWVSWQWSKSCGGRVEQYSVGILIPEMLWTGRHCEVVRTTEPFSKHGYCILCSSGMRPEMETRSQSQVKPWQRLFLSWLVPTAATMFNLLQFAGFLQWRCKSLQGVSGSSGLASLLFFQIHLCSTA